MIWAAIAAGCLIVVLCIVLLGLHCALSVQPRSPCYAERSASDRGAMKPPSRALLWLFLAACVLLVIGHFAGWSLP